MDYNNKVRKVNTHDNIERNNKESNISLFRVNDKISIKEYYNIY